MATLTQSKASKFLFGQHRTIDATNRRQKLTNYQRSKSIQFSNERLLSLPEAVVTAVKFSVMSFSDVQASSVCVITRPTCTRAGSELSECNQHTPLDSYMGENSNQVLCRTCEQLLEKCPFHLGRIDLKDKKCYSPVFKDYIQYVLKCICFNCHSLKISDSSFEIEGFHKMKGLRRLKSLVAQSEKITKCSRCLVENKLLNFSEFKKDNVITGTTGKDKDKVHYTVDTVLSIFQKLTPETVEQLGFSSGNHPVNFIIQSLPVIPPGSRPGSYTNAAGQLQEDGMTKQYSDIVKKVMDSSQPPGPPSQNEVYMEIAELFENKDRDKTKGKVNRGNFWIKALIDGKKGVIRNAIMGKRRNDTARSVLAPGPWLRFGEVGVPEKIRDIITVTEIVTAATYDDVIKLFGNSYEDCQIKSVTPCSGPYAQSEMHVASPELWERIKTSVIPGDKYQRMLRNGDPIMFNRQPTLGADNMCGYLIKFHQGMTFLVHMANTSALNADFDGDEGNAIIPQTLGSKLELMTFANVRNRIISPSTNTPSVGVVYNGLSAAYLLTQEGVELSRSNWLKAYAIAESPQGDVSQFFERCEKMGINPFSGKGLFSCLLPKDFYYKKDEVIIQRGILIKGVINGDHIGRGGNSIIQALWNQYGQKVVSNFITQIYFLLNWFISYHGLSVSLDNCCFSGQDYIEMVEYRQALVKEAQTKAYSLINDFREPSEFERSYINKQILAYTSDIKTYMTTFTKSKMDMENPLMIMIKSKAKGKEINLCQIAGTVGQQEMSGRRPGWIISDGRRCLPYFSMESNDLFANGFCEHSFSEGLSPSEMFMHWMASRISMMDTGINVPVTGNIQRRMIKAMEDITLGPDGSVINTIGSQFAPIAFDGFNPIYMTKIHGPLIGELISFIDLAPEITKLNDKYSV